MIEQALFAVAQLIFFNLVMQLVSEKFFEFELKMTRLSKNDHRLSPLTHIKNFFFLNPNLFSGK